MTTADLLDFLRTQRLAVQASRGVGDNVQAALVGIAVTDSFEIVFDTLSNSRKAENLRTNPRIALVIGGWLSGNERTVQYEGTVDEPDGPELERLKAAYFANWPDGPSRGAWPGLIYIRVRPTWIRYTDFTCDPPLIAEFERHQLAAPPDNRA
ncbi:MAG: pyridoxamine 5'-phosphate oxidase family protein [Gemmatimonadaceae bacterium]